MSVRAVTYYVHEGSDNNHYTVDTLAFVLAEVDERTLDLVIFPVGGPTRYERVSSWNEDAPLPPAGGAYWRDHDSDPPDFTHEYRWYNHPESHALLSAQAAELARTPEKDRPGLIAEHDQEWDELMDRLDGKSDVKPSAEPVDEMEARRDA